MGLSSGLRCEPRAAAIRAYSPSKLVTRVVTGFEVTGCAVDDRTVALAVS